MCVRAREQEAFPRLKGDALQAYTPRYKGTVQHEGNEFVQVLHVTLHACMHAHAQRQLHSTVLLWHVLSA